MHTYAYIYIHIYGTFDRLESAYGINYVQKARDDILTRARRRARRVKIRFSHFIIVRVHHSCETSEYIIRY